MIRKFGLAAGMAAALAFAAPLPAAAQMTPFLTERGTQNFPFLPPATQGGPYRLNNVTINATTPGPGAFTTLSATGAVSGAGFAARFAIPGPIGSTTPSTAAFTTLAASGAVSGAGFTALFASPPAIGGTAPGAGAFTTLSASGAVSGAGFTALLASPPAIGGTAPAGGAFTTLSASGAVSGAGFTALLASPPAIGGTAPGAVTTTTLRSTGLVTVTQGAPAAATTSATLTAANLLTGIITVNQGAAGASAQQLPTAADIDTALPASVAGDAFDFSVINISTVTAELATITTNTGWTLVGGMDVLANEAGTKSSGRFRARKTGTGAWVLYRLS